MRFGLALFLLTVTLAACQRRDVSSMSPTDAKLREKLLGTWTWGGEPEGSAGVNTLAPDGKFVSSSTNRWSSGSREFAYEGTWQVKDGILHLTYTKTSEPKDMPVGRIERYKIIRIDAEELADCQMLDGSLGATNSLKRKK